MTAPAMRMTTPPPPQKETGTDVRLTPEQREARAEQLHRAGLCATCKTKLVRQDGNYKLTVVAEDPACPRGTSLTIRCCSADCYLKVIRIAKTVVKAPSSPSRSSSSSPPSSPLGKRPLSPSSSPSSSPQPRATTSAGQPVAKKLRV